MTTVQDALRQANLVLAEVGIAGAPHDARRLMAATLDVGPDRVTLHSQDALDDIQEAAFFASVYARAEGTPVSHLVGGREFFGRWFVVTEDVLDPRPETEILVQEALSETFLDVLDLGTGSGAILASLLAERPVAIGVGSDISEPALCVAIRNATAHEVDTRVHFEVSDWYGSIGGQYDLIVSNPPYIAADEMEDLQPEVRLYEPRIALTDEADGLTAYRKITAGAPDHLNPGGRLIVEIGPTQAIAVSNMMQAAGLTGIEVRQDLDGRDRVVLGRKPL
ncbi:peptide chain release factor N(5)-glutamine methyltransferase [Yoonia sp. 2307UL14-13]|uniref:peptide chain release factor N(5)-glutamine methyltransferase n=1 Tax=Yoonia sp. 2307UL14-13 TaxID=3126506 RepID=UPI00309B3F16